ncbi:MAG: 1-deoxy-D-xylulose-5-phosphate synthase, partial [Blastocatellia bacterium]
MIRTAIAHPGPAALRYPRGSGVGADISSPPKLLEIGKGEMLREGEDVVIIAYGSMVMPALEAADLLRASGISAGVINARFAKPLDEDLILQAVRACRAIVTVEEAYLAGGFGSAILELLELRGLLDSIPLVRIGVPDEIVPHGDAKRLLSQYGL